MGLSIYKNKTVFLTGDTGFKGSWLSIWLLHLGAKVVGYALPPRDENEHFIRCGLDRRIRHINADIRDTTRLKKTLKIARPDFVFHLAAQSLVLDSYRLPLETFDVNIMGTLHVLEALRKVPSVKACVLITTDKVYENSENRRPFRENDPLGGHDPYSASKAGAEIVGQSYSRSFFNKDNLAVIATARSGNVMGGGDFAPYRIVPDCIRALRRGKPVPVRNPKSIRPWQHVLEPLYGYLLLGAALAINGRKYSGAWNFGPMPAQARTVRELAETVISEWGSGKIRVASESNPPREAQYLRLNSNKAKKLLKWRPTIGFKEAVKQTVSEYKEMDKLNPEELFKARLNTIRQYLSNFYQ